MSALVNYGAVVMLMQVLQFNENFLQVSAQRRHLGADDDHGGEGGSLLPSNVSET